ncbi:Arsenate reductase [compost metagenome]
MYGGPLGTICYSPACGTWRNSLAPIRNSGCEAAVIHCLEKQPSRETLGLSLPVWVRGNARADKNRELGRRQGQAKAQIRRRGACWQPGGRQESARFFPCIYTGKQEGLW